MSLGTILLLATTLVLRSGDRLPVDGAVKQEKDVITFRSGGTLYSMPAEEVVRIEEDTPAAKPAEAAKPADESVVRLRVSEEERKRLIDALEKNHSGTAPAPPPALPDAPTAAETEDKKGDEDAWRARARAYEDAVTAAKRNLAGLEEQEAATERKIMNLIALGYGPGDFTYDAIQLERARASIPRARAEIERAEKAWTDFREDARKKGILPGWLR